MIVLSAVLKAKPGKEKEMEDALKGMIPNVQNEEGTLVYTLHRSNNDPGKFFYFEKYRDQQALDIHNSTPHFKELFVKLANILRDQPDVDLYEEIDGIKR